MRLQHRGDKRAELQQVRPVADENKDCLVDFLPNSQVLGTFAPDAGKPNKGIVGSQLVIKAKTSKVRLIAFTFFSLFAAVVCRVEEYDLSSRNSWVRSCDFMPRSLSDHLAAVKLFRCTAATPTGRVSC